jgi:adenine deaminase
MNSFTISGNIVDIFKGTIYPGSIEVQNGKIKSISEHQVKENIYILPGFIDSHVHIESSMLTPSEFGRLAVVHGSVASVSDPHEIANVMGIKGVRFMIENSRFTPFKIFFGVPSCVPAITHETSGASIKTLDIFSLFENDNLLYLSEMMNFPGVLSGATDVLQKIEIAQHFNKPIDGHAPGLRGDMLKKYISAGISTDHESTSFDEALEKIQFGMKTLIREGSAAKDFEKLHALIDDYSDMCMFCSDDKHPDELVEGHINQLVRRAVAHGHDLMKVLRVASLNPVIHYGLDVGLLRLDDDADFIVVNNLKDFQVQKTYIKGELVAQNGTPMLETVPFDTINKFEVDPKIESDFLVSASSSRIRVIEAIDGEITTNEIIKDAKIINGYAVSDVENDILKLTVVNRYKDTIPSVAFIKNFGLQRGALATSVAHDSHNIIAVGTDDKYICRAVNAIIKRKGAMAVASDNINVILSLPVAGLMSDGDGYETARKYSVIDKNAKELGCKLSAPFMTLSFMALLVIPKLKLSDKGLFDGEKFEFVNLFV